MASGSELKIIRHVAERLKDHRVFKVAQNQDYRYARAPPLLRLPDSDTSRPHAGARPTSGTFDGLPGNQAAILEAHERQRYIVDHQSLQAACSRSGKLRTTRE